MVVTEAAAETRNISQICSRCRFLAHSVRTLIIIDEHESFLGKYGALIQCGDY